MNNNNFATLYKTWATDKLLDVIDNPSDYKPLAVKAAQLEIDSRQLTEEQLADAKAEQELRQQNKAQKEQKITDIGDRLKSIGTSIGGILNPPQNVTPTTNKLIALISLSICGLFLQYLYSEFSMLKFMLTNDAAIWDVSMVLSFLPLLILPTIGLLFWFRQKMGWILATIYFSWTAIKSISMFAIQLTSNSTYDPEFQPLFPETPPDVYLAMSFLSSGLTWVLCKENIRQAYRINKTAMFISLSIGAAITLLVALSFGL